MTTRTEDVQHEVSQVGPETTYPRWEQRYSGEDGDRIGGLACRLTQWDRDQGRDAPAVGHSAQRYDDARGIVDNANRHRAPVCPRCLGLAPGRPGGAPWWHPHGPFTDALCAPCEASNTAALRQEGRL